MIRKLSLLYLLAQGMCCFGEELFTLEQAVPAAFAYVRERIPDGSQVRIYPVDSDYRKVEDYIFEEWVILAVNDGNLSAVETDQPEAFSLSGSFEASGSNYTLLIRLVAPDTKKILALKRFTVVRSRTLTNMIRASGDSGDGMYSHWLGLGIGTQFGFPIIKGEPLMESYTDKYQDPSPFGFGFNFLVSVHLLKFFALQSDIIFQWNRVTEDRFWGSFDDTRLQCTLLAKLAFSLFDFVLWEPFAGVYLDVPIGELKYSLDRNSGDYSVVSATAYSVQPGFVVGLRSIIWVMVFDYRFGMDFTPTSVDSYNGQSGDLYRRYFFTISLGIQLGVFNK
jgi:hypothetical protein